MLPVVQLTVQLIQRWADNSAVAPKKLLWVSSHFQKALLTNCATSPVAISKQFNLCL